MFFSLITTFCKVAYQAGATPLALAWVRFAAFILLIGCYQLARRRPFRLPRRNLIASLPMAVGMMMMSIGYLSSVVYIKVSLAVVLLYSFPLMVGVLATVSGRERIQPVRALALVVAFAGLTLAVGLEGGALGWIGLGGATLCYVLGFVLLFAAMKLLPPSQTAVMMNIEPIVSITAATLLLGEVTRPVQWIGILIMLAALCFSALRGARPKA